MLTNTFSESRERVIGFGETAAGLGLMVGPILGGALYTMFGYSTCYYMLASLLFCDLIFTAFVMPSSMNNTSGDDYSDDDLDEGSKKLRKEADQEYDQIS